MDTPWVQLIWDKHYRNGKLPSQIKKGSFWWRDNLKLLDAFKEMAMNIQNGSTCLFWFDLWGGQVQNQTYLELFSFAKKNCCQCKKPENLSLSEKCFTYHFWRKLFNRCNFFVKYFKNNIFQIVQIRGNIFGALSTILFQEGIFALNWACSSTCSLFLALEI